MERPIDRVIKLLGSQAELARRMNVTPGFVSKMFRTGRIPAERCPDLENLTGGTVTAEEMRPDVFGRLSLNRKPAA